MVVPPQNGHRLCGAIEGRLSHFLPHWLRMGWQNVIDSRGMNQFYGGDRLSYIHPLTDLSSLTTVTILLLSSIQAY